MESDEDIVEHQGARSLTYMPWYEHVKEFLLSQCKSISIYWVGLFGAFWGLVEAASFFLSEFDLSNIYILSIGLGIGFAGALFRCLHLYRSTVPAGLALESDKVHKIAFSKKHYWEYTLALELVKSRIQRIDGNLKDVICDRVHINITKTMDVRQYIDWLETRPENLRRIVAVAKQLLIFDLVEAMHADESNEVDYHNLVRVVDLIGDIYKSAYDFEVEGREIKIPEGFEVVHEIQAGWVSVVRDGFHQMLDILGSVANRQKGDFSPIDKTIVFEELPRVDEFGDELERIGRVMRLNGE
ncbi:hypothetical protein [Alloalcanivorax mobilis]|uniref:hypothetical protein n=1 Tax=Alloalcanivorax mobilis TaxID=2019569 RepID=UPI000C78FF9B|nr:hypothetical protein [Alloalcanivorax mobilis]